MIVKVQRPLYSLDGLWLVYNEDKSLVFQLNPDDELIQKMGNRDKAYFEADLLKGATVFHRIVEDQNW